MAAVTLEDVKAHLNVDTDDDDSVLERKIGVAEEWIGHFVGKAVADFDPVPATLQEAVLQLVGHLYENREATLVGINATEIPFGVCDMIRPYREDYF